MSGHRNFRDETSLKGFDPDKTLEQMRKIRQSMTNLDLNEQGRLTYLAEGLEFFDLWTRLDDWLTSGGRAPREWYGFPTMMTAEQFDKMLKDMEEDKIKFFKALDDFAKCPGPPHAGHASSDWSCHMDDRNAK